MLTVACHSWSGAWEHFHQTSLLEPNTTMSGVGSPFFVGCHSAAISGKRETRELVAEGFFPAQYGQPLRPLVRLAGVACHWWSGLLWHFHQTFFCDRAATRSGVRSPFLAGCHSE